MRRVGWVGNRAELALGVAALCAEVGCSVVALPGAGGGGDGRAGPGSAVDVVLVDPLGVDSPWLEPGREVIMVCSAGETGAAAKAASSLGLRGPSHLVELPRAGDWLARHLGASPGGPVVGVVGAVGGAGCTTVAAALAGARPGCLLIDADPHSAGLDIPLGLDEGVGARWAAVPPAEGPLDGDLLRAALPAVGAVTVLTGHLTEPDLRSRLPAAVGGARDAFPATVVDLGRGQLTDVVAPDWVVVVLPATLAGVLGARRVADAAPPATTVVAAVRPTPWLEVADVAEQLGIPVVTGIPRLARAAELADCGELLSGRAGRALRRLGTAVWEGCA